MTTCLRKSCSFGLPRVPFVNCCQFMYLVISLLVLRPRMWDLIVSVPDHCLSFYFDCMSKHTLFNDNWIPGHAFVQWILSKVIKIVRKLVV